MAAANHWPVAIATHRLNHPEVRHYIEDVLARKDGVPIVWPRQSHSKTGGWTRTDAGALARRGRDHDWSDRGTSIFNRRPRRKGYRAPKGALKQFRAVLRGAARGHGADSGEGDGGRDLPRHPEHGELSSYLIAVNYGDATSVVFASRAGVRGRKALVAAGDAVSLRRVPFLPFCGAP